MNGLKRVNDTHGHAAGDDALVHVACAARAAIADVKDALAGRLGADEFALVLPDLNHVEANAAALRWVRDAAHAGYGTSLACGLALSPVGGPPVDPSQLLQAADEPSTRPSGPAAQSRCTGQDRRHTPCPGRRGADSPAVRVEVNGEGPPPRPTCPTGPREGGHRHRAAVVRELLLIVLNQEWHHRRGAGSRAPAVYKDGNVPMQQSVGLHPTSQRTVSCSRAAWGWSREPVGTVRDPMAA